MDYQQAISYLYASQPAFHLVGAAAYKPGLQNTERLMQHLGNPHTKMRAIHIAGTNGKGSTSHLIAATLQKAGLRVGLYTSPHLVDFRERIRINGEMIPFEQVADFVTTHLSILEDIKPSFFETTMAMAFDYFVREQCDICVIEVGLGGRLDSTNILPAYNAESGYGVMMSIITNIGLDHTEFLGTTLAQIAGEKAGIMKPNTPCVIGETEEETRPVFLQQADKYHILGDGPETTNCRIWLADECGYLKRCREREVTTCELKGIYQQKNMQTAYVALRALKQIYYPNIIFPISEAFAHVCQLTGLQGRWQILSRAPLTICDTGHNSHGLKYVIEQLRGLHCGLHIIFGMVSDKDVDVVMQMLPDDATYYFVQANTHRAIPAERMAELFRATHPHATRVHIIPNVREAIETAKRASAQGEALFIGGSNYVVAEAL